MERTVQASFGRGSTADRYKLQASWERASYRAKLIGFVATQTPWLSMRDNDTTAIEKPLTGEYHHDKQVFQQAVHDFLQRGISQIPIEKLGLVERYIAESVTLGWSSFSKPARFTVVAPVALDSYGPVEEAVRVFTFTFEKQDDGKQATISQAMYEGGLDKKLFDQQKFDEETLAAGKTLVQKDVVDILL